MVAREALKRVLIALWCLGAAAGCVKVADEAAKDTGAAIEAEPALNTVQAAEPPAVAIDPADAAHSAPVASLSDGGQESTAAVLPPPLDSTPDHPLAAVEQPVLAPAELATREPGPGPELVTPQHASPPAAAALDVTSLLTRLRKTKAINLRTKLAVKNESDELMERLRAYHQRHGTTTLAELRHSYDSLFRKLYSLLEEDDPPLARDVDRSRAAIWAILADPVQFGNVG